MVVPTLSKCFPASSCEQGGDIYLKVIYCSQNQNDLIRTTQHVLFLSLGLLIHHIGLSVGVEAFVASSLGKTLRPAAPVDRLSSTSRRRPCGKYFGSLRKRDPISIWNLAINHHVYQSPLRREWSYSSQPRINTPLDVIQQRSACRPVSRGHARQSIAYRLWEPEKVSDSVFTLEPSLPTP